MMYSTKLEQSKFRIPSVLGTIGLIFLALCSLAAEQSGESQQEQKKATTNKTETTKKAETTSKKSYSSVNLYRQKVLPILKAKCIRCHGPKEQEADLNLSTIDHLLEGSESGSIIDWENLKESLFYENVHEKTMPPEDEGALTKQEINTICNWIENSAEDLKKYSTTIEKLTDRQIIPIMLLRCSVCHGPQRQEGKLDVRSVASLLKGGKSGPAIVPGHPEKSLLLKQIHSGKMPPKRKITAVSIKQIPESEIELITKWIKAGVPISKAKIDQIVEQNNKEKQPYWAFQPPRRPTIPQVKNKSQVINEIDQFVLHRLEKKGLTLSPMVDRNVLIRRLSFDLRGLPPTYQEVEAFLADRRADAYQRLVDRFLNSPQYGERWGRHWLDLAGYSDSEGVQNSDNVRPQAYRYRDYVIRAFNNDKPYNEFLLQQIAGDELEKYEAGATVSKKVFDNLVATGFLRMAPDGTNYNITNYVPDRLDIIDNEMEVLSSTVFGLTMQCARCHSHKFDPISHKDYHRMLAIFKGAYDEHDWMPSQTSSYTKKLKPRYLTVKLADKKNYKIRALWDRGRPSPTFVMKRGNYEAAGSWIRPDVPHFLKNTKQSLEIKKPWPGSKKTGRRLAFARWLTQPDHPLTSRVMVNRIWKHHFGRGIVSTLDNFGKAGVRPTHPLLLDYLATEFVRTGWSIKKMHRLMVNSHVYRQSSKTQNIHVKKDPENQLFSRMPLLRLEGEALRDSILFAAGKLDLTQFGKAAAVIARADGLVVSKGSNGMHRRSIYLLQRRSKIPSLLQTFDAPNMNPNCTRRNNSIVAPQALFLLNNKLLYQLAGNFAQRVISEKASDTPEKQIKRLYQIAYSRNPDSEELRVLLDGYENLFAHWKKKLPGEQIVEAKTHLWIRESQPKKVYENDLISVWSSNSPDKARRYGIVEFDLTELKGVKIKRAYLELGVIEQQGTIKQTAAFIPPGVEKLTWNQFLKNKKTQMVNLKSLGTYSSEQKKDAIGQHATTKEATAQELKQLTDRIQGHGSVAFVLMANEDKTFYRRDWDDGVYSKSLKLSPRLIIYTDKLDFTTARKRTLQNIAHALINSAEFSFID